MPIKVHKASEFLQTPEDIAAYLNATIEEMDELTNQKKHSTAVAIALTGRHGWSNMIASQSSGRKIWRAWSWQALRSATLMKR